MTAIVVLVFGLVYLGMILGGLPFVQLDRTGVALLGAIALVGVGVVTPDAAARRGIRLDWRVHARVGVPVTLATLAICAGYGGWRLSARPRPGTSA